MSRPRYRWQDELDALSGGSAAAPVPRRYRWQDELDALVTDTPLVAKTPAKAPLRTGWTPAENTGAAGSAGDPFGRSATELFRRDDGTAVTVGQPRGVGVPGSEIVRLTTTGTLPQRIGDNIRATRAALKDPDLFDATVAPQVAAIQAPGKAATYANVALSSAIGSMLSGVLAQKGVEGALAQYAKNPNAEPLDEDALKYSQWGGTGMGLVAQAFGPAVINLGRAGAFSARAAKAVIEGTVTGSAMGAAGGATFGAVESNKATDLLPDVGGMVLGREAMDPGWRAAAREAITGGVYGAVFGGALHTAAEAAGRVVPRVVGGARAVRSAVKRDMTLTDMRQTPDYKEFVANYQRQHDAALFDNAQKPSLSDPPITPAVTAKIENGAEGPGVTPENIQPAATAKPQDLTDFDVERHVAEVEQLDRDIASQIDKYGHTSDERFAAIDRSLAHHREIEARMLALPDAELKALVSRLAKSEEGRRTPRPAVANLLVPAREELTRRIAAAPVEAKPPKPEFPFPTMREGTDRLRRVGAEKKVSTEGLLDELDRQISQRDAAQGRGVYRFVEADVSGKDAAVMIPVADRKGGGVSKQAKAGRNVEDATRVIARLESELESRGVDLEEVRRLRQERLEADEEARLERELIQQADRPQYVPKADDNPLWWDADYDDGTTTTKGNTDFDFGDEPVEAGAALGKSAQNTTISAMTAGAPPAPSQAPAARASIATRIKNFVTGKAPDDHIPWSRRAISQQLADDIGLTGTLRERKVKNRRWAGVFNEKSGVSRSRRLDDVPTVVHELMHSVDSRWVRKGSGPLPYIDPVQKQELMAIGRGMYPNAKTRQAVVEGLAEYARHYVELDDARLTQMRQAFPNATAFFDKNIFDGGPQVRGAFDQARQRFQQYATSPDDAKIASQLAMDVEKPSRDWSWSRVRTRLFDDKLPWKEAGDELDELQRQFPLSNPDANWVPVGGGAPDRLAAPKGVAERIDRWWNGDNSPKDNAYLLARTAKAASAEGEVWLRDGIATDPTLPDQRISKGLKRIIESIAPEDQQPFVQYLVAESALERNANGIDAGVDLTAARNTVKRDAAKFADAARDIWEYRLGLLVARRDAGLLSGDAFNRVIAKNKRNVPFNRVIDPNETATVPLGAGGGMAKTGSGLHSQHGSSRLIIDPIESLIRETYRTAQDIAEFRAVRAMIDEARATKFGGGVIERVPADLEKNMVPAAYTAKKVLDFLGSGGATQDDIAEALLSLGIDADNISPDDFVGAWWSTRQHQNAQDRLNMIFPSVDPKVPDKVEFYQVKNPDLYEAMVNQPPAVWGSMGRLVSIPVRALRVGSTTLSTAFAARNLFRDAQQAFVFGRGRTTAVPFEQFSRGLFDMISTSFGGDGSLRYREWQSTGGPNAALLGLDNKAHRQAVRDWRKSKARKVGDMVVSPVRHPVQFMRAISDVAENATRLGEYKMVYNKLIAEGRPHAEAVRLSALASRDVSTDFARGGDVSRGLSQFMAFFNANTQGAERFGREVFGNIVNDPKRAAKVWTRGIVGITLPSIANYLYHTRNEDAGIRAAYKATPRYQRAFGWPIYFRTGPNTIRYILIPKGFDVGTFFGTIPERIAEYIDEKDPRSLDAMWDATRQTFNPFSMPAAVAGVYEWNTGKSTFRNRPLVPRGLERAMPEDQAQSYTGETARVLGKMIGKSPAKIENLAGVQFGVAGRDALSALDAGVRLLRDQAGLPALRDVRAGDDRRAGLENTPGLNAFLRPRAGLDAEPVEAFFEMFNEADALRTSYHNANQHRRAELDADPEKKILREAMNTSTDNRSGPPGFLRDARRQFDKMREQRQAVQANKALTPAMRRERLRKIDDDIIAYTAKVRTTMRKRLKGE